jgi:hypothetical protein
MGPLFAQGNMVFEHTAFCRQRACSENSCVSKHPYTDFLDAGYILPIYLGREGLKGWAELFVHEKIIDVSWYPHT